MPSQDELTPKQQRRSDELFEFMLVNRVAATFSKMIRGSLTAEQLAEAVRLNKEEDNGMVCHTHDFIDANITMYAALCKHGLADIEGELENRVWNEAWDLAADNGFAL